jgi:hypothetical protein
MYLPFTLHFTRYHTVCTYDTTFTYLSLIIMLHQNLAKM